jgi:hypothetical protein
MRLPPAQKGITQVSAYIKKLVGEGRDITKLIQPGLESLLHHLLNSKSPAGRAIVSLDTGIALLDHRGIRPQTGPLLGLQAHTAT